jgi:hypothetical protein
MFLPLPYQSSNTFYQGQDVEKKTQIEKYKQNINVVINNKYPKPK